MFTAESSDRQEETPNLSEESEEEILRMVEEQLDRPNPPSTKVLYRRAMHFIDRDVRRLSLQQFNAKFPLQVKRRQAQATTDGDSNNEPSPKRSGGRTPPQSASRRTGNGGAPRRDPTLEAEPDPSSPAGEPPKAQGTDASHEGESDAAAAGGAEANFDRKNLRERRAFHTCWYI